MKKLIIGLVAVVIIGLLVYVATSDTPSAVETPVVNDTTESGTVTTQTVTTTTDTPSAPALVVTQAKIDIKNFEFTPKTLMIKKGSTVTWTNMDSVAHNVISDEGSLLNSPQLANSQTYTQIFSDAGIYLYHCSLHPSMTGTIIVEN